MFRSLLFAEALLAVVDLGMCAGHIYPVILEHPAMIALDVLIAVSHCAAIAYHASTRNSHRQPPQ